MHWVLQDNLINPTTRDHVRRLLAERQVEHTLVRLVPFFHQIDGEMPNPVGPVFVYGSTGLGAVARHQGWAPGYFDENLDYELMLGRYGKMALNHGAVCATLQEMPRVAERFFVRPVLDNKSFAGTVMTWGEFELFRQGVSEVSEDKDVTLRLADRIVAAPLTDISAEYRFFVIRGEVVTGCRYKTGEHVASCATVPTEVAAFARACVAHWKPNDAFTIDLAETPTGPKVIELNSANSAGFYAWDVGAIIDAVNSLPDRSWCTFLTSACSYGGISGGAPHDVPPGTRVFLLPDWVLLSAYCCRPSQEAVSQRKQANETWQSSGMLTERRVQHEAASHPKEPLSTAIAIS